VPGDIVSDKIHLVLEFDSGPLAGQLHYDVPMAVVR